MFRPLLSYQDAKNNLKTKNVETINDYNIHVIKFQDVLSLLLQGKNKEENGTRLHGCRFSTVISWYSYQNTLGSKRWGSPYRRSRRSGRRANRSGR